jgi:flagellar protein FlaG
MDTVTSVGVAGNHPEPTALRPRPTSAPNGGPTAEKAPAERQPREAVSSSAVPISEVAAEVSKGKADSLSHIRSVSETIEEAVEVLNETLSRKDISASITHDDQLNRYLVTIRDEKSGEVVREIPDEALIKFARNLEELKGVLFDETL